MTCVLLTNNNSVGTNKTDSALQKYHCLQPLKSTSCPSLPVSSCYLVLGQPSYGIIVFFFNKVTENFMRQPSLTSSLGEQSNKMNLQKW